MFKIDDDGRVEVDDQTMVTCNCTSCDRQIEVPEAYFECYYGTVFCSELCEETFREEWQ